MSLLHFPADARVRAVVPRFAFNDEVCVGGDPRVARVAHVIADPAPGIINNLLIAFDDGSFHWTNERHLRAVRRTGLELVAGGASW